MNTITAEELLKRANESLGPEMVQHLRDEHAKVLAKELQDRQVGAAITVDRLRLTSTAVDFEVDPKLQQYKETDESGS